MISREPDANALRLIKSTSRNACRLIEFRGLSCPVPLRTTTAAAEDRMPNTPQWLVEATPSGLGCGGQMAANLFSFYFASCLPP